MRIPLGNIDILEIGTFKELKIEEGDQDDGGVRCGSHLLPQHIKKTNYV